MTQQNLMELARQGDPHAIAEMMNRNLQPRGITATAERQGDRLDVTLESAQALNPQGLAAFVKNGMTNLGITAFRSVKVMGKQPGAALPTWEQEISMEGVTAANGVPTRSAPPPPPRMAPPPPPPVRPDAAATAGVGLADSITEPLPTNGLSSEVSAASANSPIGGEDIDLSVLPELPVDYPLGTPLGGESASTTYDYSAPDYSIPDYSAPDYAIPEYDAADSGDFIDDPSATIDLSTESGLYDPDEHDWLPGTHGLDHPDHPLEEHDDDINDLLVDIPAYRDPAESVPEAIALDDRSTAHTLDHPDDLAESDDFLRDPEDDPVLAPVVPVVPDADDFHSLPGTHGLDHPDHPLAEHDDDLDDFLDSDPNDPNDVREIPVDDPHPVRFPSRYDADIDLEDDDETDEDRGKKRFTMGILLVVIGWIIGLVSYSLLSNLTNPSPQPDPLPDTASSPPASAGASPSGAGASPGGTNSGAAGGANGSGSPTATSSPGAVPIAAANAPAPPGPPTIACQPASGNVPVNLSGLNFDRTVVGADGDYLVGCLTNNTDKAIGSVTLSFRGTSPQDPSVVQIGSTQLNFAPLQPQQSVPFRSRFTINPAVTNLKIESIAWTAQGNNQPQQSRTTLTLTR